MDRPPRRDGAPGRPHVVTDGAALGDSSLPAHRDCDPLQLQERRHLGRLVEARRAVAARPGRLAARPGSARIGRFKRPGGGARETCRADDRDQIGSRSPRDHRAPDRDVRTPIGHGRRPAQPPGLLCRSASPTEGRLADGFGTVPWNARQANRVGHRSYSFPLIGPAKQLSTTAGTIRPRRARERSGREAPRQKARASRQARPSTSGARRSASS